jgi:esterase/lipase superfamily enzyme
MMQVNRGGFEVQMYQVDRLVVEQEGAPALGILLEMIQTKLAPSAINIIAHSMGARLTLTTLTRHVRTAKLRRLVLLAPDIEAASILDPKVHAAFQPIEAIHVYFSRNDEALSYSEIVNRGVSLGLQGPGKTSNLPANVHFHDVTAALGAGDSHGRYLKRQGAAEIVLSESLR